MHCDLDLFWPFDLKIYRAHPCLMGSLHVKFHDDRCKGKAVMRRKQKCGRTDGRTDRRTCWFQYTPPNFVAGGIKMVPHFLYKLVIVPDPSFTFLGPWIEIISHEHKLQENICFSLCLKNKCNNLCIPKQHI